MLQQKIWAPLPAILFGSLLLFSTSCDKDDDDDEPKTEYTISGTASGAQEVPAVTTTGTGTVSGTYNSSTNVLNYNINWSNVKAIPTMMHFHGPALPGENAPPIITITPFTPNVTGSATGTANLTDAQETDLLAGKWYYNLHTPSHPGGEIRAQITAQ